MSKLFEELYLPEPSLGLMSLEDKEKVISEAVNEMLHGIAYARSWDGKKIHQSGRLVLRYLATKYSLPALK